MRHGTNSACRVIFLNGASCSGKTTIAGIVQENLKESYLHFSVDHILQMLPERFRDWQDPNGTRIRLISMPDEVHD